jgi:hypothetical protein
MWRQRRLDRCQSKTFICLASPRGPRSVEMAKSTPVLACELFCGSGKNG